MKELPQKSGTVLFEIFLRAYENRSTIIGDKLIGDLSAGAAIWNRLLPHCPNRDHAGPGYRLRNQAADPAP